MVNKDKCINSLSPEQNTKTIEYRDTKDCDMLLKKMYTGTVAVLYSSKELHNRNMPFPCLLYNKLVRTQRSNP